MELKIGVVNPYAIAELVAKKQIRWSSLANPAAELSAILQIPENKIFSADSALLRPNAITDSSGNLKTLSAVDAHSRLDGFLKVNLPEKPVLHPSRISVLTSVNARTLTESLTQTGNTNQPWQPADTVWVDKGDFFEDLDEVNDPIQGGLANCYFISALSSVAWSRPYAIANVVRPSAWGNDDAPIHRVTFYKDGAGNGEAVEVNEQVPCQQGSQAWKYARSRDAAEIWPAVLEKAFGKWITGNTTEFPDYNPMAYGDPVLATAQIVRGTRNYQANASNTADALVQFVRSNSLGKRTFNPMVAWTYGSAPSGLDYVATKVVANHAYSILGWEWVNNTYYVVLRNPWGTHEATIDVLPNSWTSSQNYSATIPLNTEGVFAMKASTFKQYFAGLGWVV